MEEYICSMERMDDGTWTGPATEPTELVRCCDCIYSERWGADFQAGCLVCDIDIYPRRVPRDGFCNFGRRKE